MVGSGYAAVGLGGNNNKIQFTLLYCDTNKVITYNMIIPTSPGIGYTYGVWTSRTS